MKNLSYKLKYIFLYTNTPIIISMLIITGAFSYLIYSKKSKEIEFTFVDNDKKMSLSKNITSKSKNITSELSLHIENKLAVLPKESVNKKEPLNKVRIIPKAVIEKTGSCLEMLPAETEEASDEYETIEDEALLQEALNEEFIYRSIEETGAADIKINEPGSVNFTVETITNQTMMITSEKIASLYLDTFSDVDHVSVSLVDENGEVIGGRVYPRGFMGDQPIY